MTDFLTVRNMVKLEITLTNIVLQRYKILENHALMKISEMFWG